MAQYWVTAMKPNYKPPFSKFVKKAHKPLQLAIEDAVDEVCDNPEIGEAKVGDLAGIRVYKFKFNRQEYLIAYRRPTPQGIDVELLIIDFIKWVRTRISTMNSGVT